MRLPYKDRLEGSGEVLPSCGKAVLKGQPVGRGMLNDGAMPWNEAESGRRERRGEERRARQGERLGPCDLRQRVVPSCFSALPQWLCPPDPDVFILSTAGQQKACKAPGDGQ